jgi:hypothetical protein
VTKSCCYNRGKEEAVVSEHFRRYRRSEGRTGAELGQRWSNTASGLAKSRGERLHPLIGKKLQSDVVRTVNKLASG